MTQVHRIAILIPLAVAASAIACTIIIRALAMIATVNFVRRERRLGRVGADFSIDLSIVALAISIALMAHLIEIAIWAILFLVCGEFSDFGTAYYHSAVNYTTLGYGDVDYDTLMENAGTARSSERDAHVWHFNRHHFRCHATVDSGQVCRS